MKRNVVLISRLSTQNAGNEALSKIFLDYFSKELSDCNVFGLDRYPRKFESYTVAKLGNDVISAFDNLAYSQITKFNRSEQIDLPKASPNLVRLDHTAKELKGPLKTLKRRIAIRRRLAHFGLIEKQGSISAVSACANADLVVWNPAGEIHPSGSIDQVFRLLLLLRIAQISGKRTAVINHSLEVNDNRLATLITHVYSKMEYVGVRDKKSVERALELGVKSSVIREAPDLVFLASRDASEAPVANAINNRVYEGSIGLAINGLEAMKGENEWDEFVAGIKKIGLPTLFLSNAVNHDITFANELAPKLGNASVITYQPGYKEIRALFGACSVLVSSRLHSSILALCEGVPVVSIEPSVFKLTAIFEQLDYPIKTENLSKAGWAKRTIRAIEECLGEKQNSLSELSLERADMQAQRIVAAYEPLLKLAYV